MKLGIIGYGRMGKLIEQLAKSRGHEIISIIDVDSKDEINKNVDCYIDFSVADALDKHLPVICNLKIPIIIGVTGWNDKLENYKKLFLTNQNIGIWGGNFSLGVNLFWKVIKQSTQIFDKFSNEYDILVHEFHHKNKIDSPSGTAIQTAQNIIDNSNHKNTMITEKLDRKRNENEIHVSSSRGGSIPGTHTVMFDSNYDTIEIVHTARSREGFAIGAILAAEKISSIPPGLHNFSEIFDSIA
ncbi:MAG TPA: 4-hydroxy-tetrahydrodipicolinate reductase [Bacteroidales bacterium]|nr:4-hydroxy-tetrahydrodipicolinate reductase [Bacteroidales bacterium]HQI44871.1 4-hydroxy-tetrahydrodipicolinate reductase [Bacteroidales bacterium]